MKRFDFDGSSSGTFCMEPEQATMKRQDARRDDVSESQQRQWMKQLREMPDVRLKKIMKIRAEIAKGTYETEAKWKVALDRLLEDLRG